MRKINKIIVHCTATPQGSDRTVANIKKWHTTAPPNGRGWSDIGYHYIIYLDGSIHNGRDIKKDGFHTLNHNKGSIGVVYVGGTDKDLKPLDTINDAQLASLVLLLRGLQATYPSATIHGHNEFAVKACPSFSIKEKILPLL